MKELEEIEDMDEEELEEEELEEEEEEEEEDEVEFETKEEEEEEDNKDDIDKQFKEIWGEGLGALDLEEAVGNFLVNLDEVNFSISSGGHPMVTYDMTILTDDFKGGQLTMRDVLVKGNAEMIARSQKNLLVNGIDPRSITSRSVLEAKLAKLKDRKAMIKRTKSSKGNIFTEFVPMKKRVAGRPTKASAPAPAPASAPASAPTLKELKPPRTGKKM